MHARRDRRAFHINDQSTRGSYRIGCYQYTIPYGDKCNLLLLYFLVQPGLFGQQFFLSLNHVRIRHAAVYRAHSGTLRLFMETGTFCAFARYDVVKFIGHGRLSVFCINRRSVFQFNCFQLGSPGPVPLLSAFIDGCIGAFRFTCTSVDALVRNYNCHAFSNFTDYKFTPIQP